MWKKINNFFKLCFINIKNELFFNKKQLLKTIGLFLIALIYGFGYVFAFWDPISKFDEVPFGMVDKNSSKCWDINDKSIKVDTKYNNSNSCIANNHYWGTLAHFMLLPISIDSNKNILQIKNNNLKININYTQNEGKHFWSTFYLPKNFDDNIATLFNTLLKFNEKAFPDIKIYEKALFNQFIKLEGGQVINAPDKSDKDYINYKKANGPDNGDYKNNKIIFQNTYSKNYVVGYFSNMVMSYFNSIFEQSIPSFMLGLTMDKIELNTKEINTYKLNKNVKWYSQNKYNNYKNSLFFATLKLIFENSLSKEFPYISELIKDLDNTSNLFSSGTEEITGDVVISKNNLIKNFNKNIIEKNNMFKASNFIKIEIQGVNFNKYGFGLGQMFINIGIFMAMFVQTIVLSRNRKNKQSFIKNYINKFSITLLVGFIQTNILFLGLAIIGFSEMKVGLLWLYLSMMLSALVLSMIVFSIWYMLRDEFISKIILILILVISIVAGAGLFPNQMQNNFLTYLSYVNPFTYLINNQNIILYGSNIIGWNNIYINRILINTIIILSMSFLMFIIGMIIYNAKQKFKILSTTSNKKLILFIKEKNIVKEKIWYKYDKEESEIIKKYMENKYPLNKKISNIFKDIHERDKF